MRSFPYSRSAISRSVTAAVASLVTAGSGGALAQVDTGGDVLLEEVVVTGSRIVRRELATPAPINVVDETAIAASGETDVAQLLREVPALNGSLPSTNSTNTGFDSDLADDTGVGRLNLRNLGTNRTLVLVNGRRHVSAIQGSSDVDVGTIPVALIERVETLTGGSSAVYGADAVTGVVNFVLKDDLEGVDYRFQQSLSGEGDAANTFAAFTFGKNFNDGRGNITFAAEYTNQDSLQARDRDFARNEGRFALLANTPELAARFGRNPDAANAFVPDFRINYSSSSGVLAVREAGTGFFGSVFWTVGNPDDVDGLIPGVPALQTFRNGEFREFDRGLQINAFQATGGDGIETVNPYELIVPELERYNLNLLGKYDFDGGWRAYTELKYVTMSTLDSDGIPFNDDIPIALDNAFIPQGLRDQLDTAVENGITPQITMSRDILDEAVISTSDTTRDTARAVFGLSKDFKNGMRFDVSFNYGRTDIETKARNSRLEDRFFAAVDAVVDPATGNVVCRSDLDPTAEPPLADFPAARSGFLTFTPGDGTCQPINLFGTDSIGPEARGFAFVDALYESEIEQTQILATLAGDTAEWFTLPAGPALFAVGYEYREEQSSFTPSQLEVDGLLYNTLSEPQTAVEGEYDVSELFGEVSVPLLSDIPGIEALTLDASYRYTDHSTAGGIDTYGVGLMWQVYSDVTLRGSYNRAVRAPNIFELFSPAQVATLNVGSDPCNTENIDAGTEFRQTNCLQFVEPGFNAANFLSARTAGTTGGNPELDPEEADTYTVGIVFEPEFLPGLLVTLDYYKIEIIDGIDSLTGARIAELCVDLPTIDNPFCSQITRDPNRGNAIVDFESGNVNLAGFETDGIDLAVTFDHDLLGGSVRHSVVSNYVLTNSEFPDPLDPSFELDDVGEIAVPELIINYNLGWMRNNFRADWQVRWQDSQLLPGIENEDVAGNPLFADPLKTGDVFVHDVSFRWDLAEAIALTGGVNNLTDEEPFLDTLIRPVGPIGRTFFLGVQGTF